MADNNLTRTRGRYYTPAAQILACDGVTVEHEITIDTYRGTIEALSASGLLPREFFPGQPGMPKTNADFRPAGFAKAAGESWHDVPGYLVIQLRLDGSFFARVRVSDEEVIKRRSQSKAAEMHIDERAAVGLEIHRYGQRLMNVYGSSKALIQAGLLPDDFNFPDCEDHYDALTRWVRNGIEYKITRRWTCNADRVKEVKRDHWWFQVIDPRVPYPDNLYAIHRAEIERASR